MNAYSRRNLLLLQMGYKDYRAYLRSPLWASIRARKLKMDRRCFGCGKNAWQVHHGAYHRDNLTGVSLRDLYSICGKCHQTIEVTSGGFKRNPTQATQQLRRIRRMRLGRKRVRVDNRINMRKIQTTPVKLNGKATL